MYLATIEQAATTTTEEKKAEEKPGVVEQILASAAKAAAAYAEARAAAAAARLRVPAAPAPAQPIIVEVAQPVMPPWVWPVAGVMGLGAIGAAVYFATRKR